jgi:hypothetical protein
MSKCRYSTQLNSFNTLLTNVFRYTLDTCDVGNARALFSGAKISITDRRNRLGIASINA